jgi:NDP-sugar pyrophosphorylase family protein
VTLTAIISSKNQKWGTMDNLNIVIPMAGLGSRFVNSGILDPKPLIEVNGKTLIQYSIESLNINANYIFITKDYKNESYNEKLSKLLKNLAPNCTEIRISKLTSGAVETCLASKDLIDTEHPLIITNCDQLTLWDSSDFLATVKHKSVDGSVVLFKSHDIKNSFAEINNDLITKIVEKKNISDNALVGIHYWKHGKDFVISAEKLLHDFRKNGSPECYISETYNYLIGNGKKVIPYFLQKNGYVPLGTPEDVAKYKGKIREFYSAKPKTVFCDIDGTILKHVHSFSDVYSTEPQLLDGVLDKFNDWDSRGYKIVLTTARKESARKITETHLESLGLCWDYLLMNVTSGDRILINDKLMFDDPDRAQSVNVITNTGFNTIEWERFGL